MARGPHRLDRCAHDGADRDERLSGRGEDPMAQSDAPHVRGFLFADLRGYTEFVERHGDKAASELLK